MRRALIALSIVVACSNSNKSVVDKPTGSGSMNKTMGSRSDPAFVKGATLTPAKELVAWMDGQKRGTEPRLLRLVVVVPKHMGAFDISKARLGTSTGALEVYANDSALGVGLADRADQNAADDDTAAFLVEGYWRGMQLGGLQLDVMKAEFLPADQAAKVTHAEVEGESGN